MTSRRVAVLTRPRDFVGPALARRLASSGHDLVLLGAAPGQAEQLAALGAEVEVLEQPGLDTSPAGWREICDATRSRFGRLDAAALFPPPSGPPFTEGPFLDATVEQVQDMAGYFSTTLYALQAVVPMMRSDGGQIVVFTSDSGTRPVPGWSLYGAVRAGQTFLVRAVALEHAHEGIMLNAVCSKNAVFEGFPGAPPGAVSDSNVTPGEWSAALEAETPVARLGTMDELAAFSQVLLDGSNRFQTAHAFSFSGGWHAC